MNETTTQLSRNQVLMTFGGLLLAMLLASLDQTIVATALPTIVGELGGLDQLSWVVTAYLLAATVSMPLWGRISDLYGRKRLFQTAIVVFLAGSALSGVAQSLGELIAFRAPSGTRRGRADDACDGDRRRHHLAARARPVPGLHPDGLRASQASPGRSSAGCSSINSPGAGSSTSTCRSGSPHLPLVSSTLQVPAARGRPRIDYLGAALLGAGITCVLLLTTWGGRQYAWDSVEIIGLAAAAAALLVLFVAQERRTPEPILPLRLFAEPVFTVVSVVLLLTTCALFAAIVFMPLFLQIVTGASATESGLLLLPLLLAATTTTAIVGRVISRTGRYKVFPAAGLALMSVGLFLLSRLDATTSRATASLFMVVFGLGFGMVSQVLVLAIQNAVDRRDIGIATASANLFRSLGGSVGVALFGAIFASRLATWLPRELPARAPRIDAHTLQASPETLASMPPAVHEGVGRAVAHSLETVFLVAAPIAALGFLVVLFLNEVPLRGPAGGPPGEKQGERGEPGGATDGADSAPARRPATAGATR